MFTAPGTCRALVFAYLCGIMETKQGDLFYNAGEFLYLRASGQFFKRIVGIGWVATTQEQVPDLSRFAPLHPKQKSAYLAGLIEAGYVE